jgi:hypothetical protein
VKTTTRIDHVGAAGFPGLLIEEGVIARHDLTVAEQQAARDRTDLAETLVALGIATEGDVYRVLSRAAGAEFISLENRPSSGRDERLDVLERLDAFASNEDAIDRNRAGSPSWASTGA